MIGRQSWNRPSSERPSWERLSRIDDMEWIMRDPRRGKLSVVFVGGFEGEQGVASNAIDRDG